MTSKGWFLVHRGWMTSPDFQPEPFTEREAFLWSIEQAAFEPHLQWFNGVQIPVGRGEFVTSSRKMAAAFRWGEKRARLFIARMERREKWALRETQLGAHGPRVLTVCNYDRFQTAKREEGAASDAAEGAAGAQAGRSQDAQQNECLKNGNEGERREIEAAPAARAPSLPYDLAVEAWSQIAPLKGWTPAKPTLPLSAKRLKMLGGTLKVHGIEGWIAGLQRAADSPLLGGPDPPGWFNFEFAINPNNFLKLYEGNYDKSFSGTPANSDGSAWLDARQSMLTG
jgi:hypothetical protein